MHHLNRWLNYIPSLIATFFITFFVFTALLSLEKYNLGLDLQVTNSYTNQLAEKIYHSSMGISEAQLFGGIMFKITDAVSVNKSSPEDKVDAQVAFKIQEQINRERVDQGLPEVGMQIYYPIDEFKSLPLDQESSIAQKITTKTQSPSPSPSPTPQPSVKISPINELTKTPTPRPTETPMPTPKSVNISEQEQKVHQLINQIRVEYGLEPLVWDDNIAAVARAHSRDMNDKNFFEHTNLEGVTFDQRLKLGGLQFNAASENIVGAKSAISMVNAWMNSEGHRKNLLAPNIRKTGVGIVTNSKYGLLGTQDFTD